MVFVHYAHIEAQTTTFAHKCVCKNYADGVFTVDPAWGAAVNRVCMGCGRPAPRDPVALFLFLGMKDSDKVR